MPSGAVSRPAGALWSSSSVAGGGGYAEDTDDAGEHGSSDEECRFHRCSEFVRANGFKLLLSA